MHVPVLLSETLEALDPRPGRSYIDGTLGGGGHAEAILRASAPDGRLLGLDRDPAAIDRCRERLAPFGARFEAVHAEFASIADVARERGFDPADGILLDLGVSSFQLDEPARGFSFREDGPLDMRMDPTRGETAAELLAGYGDDWRSLAALLRELGEEPNAGRIARAILAEQAKAPIETTFQLVEIVKQAIPAADRRRGGHPARKTFQALRIEVNHELEVLEEGLRAAIRWANPGGRICVIAYHSLEDRIVKHVFSEMSQGCTCPPDLPVCVCGRVPIVDVKTKKPLVASDEELRSNPRARSALMRVAVKR